MSPSTILTAALKLSKVGLSDVSQVGDAGPLDFDLGSLPPATVRR